MGSVIYLNRIRVVMHVSGNALFEIARCMNFARAFIRKGDCLTDIVADISGSLFHPPLDFLFPWGKVNKQGRITGILKLLFNDALKIFLKPPYRIPRATLSVFCQVAKR